MDQSENELNLPKALVLSSTGIGYLSMASKWARILAILGFIFSGLVIIIGVGMWISILAFMLDTSPREPGIVYESGGALAFTAGVYAFYIACAAFQFFISFRLYRFATHTVAAIAEGDSGNLKSGITNLKSFFIAIGIAAIVGFALNAMIISWWIAASLG